VKPAAFEYVRPRSLDEALDALADGGDDAKAIAGGQSLVPVLNMRLLRPALLVDLNRVPGLDGIAQANGGVRVGALVRQTAMESSPLVRRRIPLAAEALPHVGHFVTRNRGTVGGSIAHADASAELPLALVVLGGSVVTRSPRGGRELPADAFFVTHFTTELEPDELVVETVWPGAGPASGFAFEELALRAGDYALCTCACALRVEEERALDVRIGLGSVVDRPSLVAEAAALVEGETVTLELAREAGAAAAATVDPAGSIHATPAYLSNLVRVLVERALLRAWRNAREGGPL